MLGERAALPAVLVQYSYEEQTVSQLRMLLASVTAALAIAFVGPLFIGAAPALADGYHPVPPPCSSCGTHHHPPVCSSSCFPHTFPVVIPIVQPQVVTPVVTVVQPQVVVYPVTTVSYQVSTTVCLPASYGYSYSTSYFWMGYGPNWNNGCTTSQLQQFCQMYNQAVMANPAAYNQYVQIVCNTIGGIGYPYSVYVDP
jgi:hypothetical protein